MLYKVSKLSCGFYYIRIGLSTAAAGIACGYLAVPNLACNSVYIIIRYHICRIAVCGNLPNAVPIKLGHCFLCGRAFYAVQIRHFI